MSAVLVPVQYILTRYEFCPFYRYRLSPTSILAENGHAYIETRSQNKKAGGIYAIKQKTAIATTFQEEIHRSRT